MKFPEEPKSTRAETETEDSGVSSCTGSRDNVETAGPVELYLPRGVEVSRGRS